MEIDWNDWKDFRDDNGGVMRRVFFLWGYVFKVPRLNFRFHLNRKSNSDEYKHSINPAWKDKLCPIMFHLPFGLLNVMPRVRVLNNGELSRKELREFCRCADGPDIPTELSDNSFGYLNGKLVCIDYHDYGLQETV